MTFRFSRMLGPLAALLVLGLVISAVALAADTNPKRRITAADQAKARAMVLKRTDFAAGWTRVAVKPDAEELVCRDFNPDESDLTLTGETRVEFAYPQGAVSTASFSAVYASKSDAVKSWTRNDKPAIARCIGQYFRKGLAAPGTVVEIVSAGRMAFPKLAPRTTAYKVVARVSVTANGQTQSVPFTIQFFALGRGRGDTAMYAVSPGAGVAAAELRVLGKLLAQRLAAARL